VARHSGRSSRSAPDSASKAGGILAWTLPFPAPTRHPAGAPNRPEESHFTSLFRYSALIGMFIPSAPWILGRVIVRRPFLNVAEIFFSSMDLGSRTLLAKDLQAPALHRGARREGFPMRWRGLRPASVLMSIGSHEPCQDSGGTLLGVTRIANSCWDRQLCRFLVAWANLKGGRFAAQIPANLSGGVTFWQRIRQRVVKPERALERTEMTSFEPRSTSPTIQLPGREDPSRPGKNSITSKTRTAP
jgi:hypothetical protein